MRKISPYESAREALLEACREFVRKVERGDAHSRKSYAQMKAAIALAEAEDRETK